MKIVHLRSQFDPVLGYDTLILPLYQKKLGHDVYVISTDIASTSNVGVGMLPEDYEQSLKKGYSEVEGIKVYRVKHFLNYSDFVLGKGVGRFLNQIKPDVVHAYAAREGFPISCCFLKKKLGFVFFIREDQHDLPPITPYLKRVLMIIEFLMFRRFFCNFIYRRADLVLETYLGGIEFIKRVHKFNQLEKVKCMHFCVDTNLFRKDEIEGEKIRNKYEINENDILVLLVGKIVPVKNFELLFKAFGCAAEKYPVKFMLIGGFFKSYKKKLEKISKDLGFTERLIFVDPVDHYELFKYYGAADIGIWNRESTSIYEAMSSGLPVIVPEHIKKNHLSFAAETFKDKDVEDLKIVLKDMCENRIKRKEMGEEAALLARQDFNIEKQAESFIEMYRSYIK